MKKRLLALLLAAAMILALSGCLKSTEDLYQLPHISEEYKELQSAIEAVLGSDAEYAAPVSGSNRQAIQLSDLDGDGEYEAIAFVRTSGELPLKAYIFALRDDAYQNIAIIEGNGSSFQSVEYIQLDGEGGAELVLASQVSNQISRALSVYSLRKEGLTELMSAACSEYRAVDLNQDGKNELFLVRFSSDEPTGAASLFYYENDSMVRLPEAYLSQGVTTIRRIITGKLAENVPAVFVAGIHEEDSLVTDVFALRNGALTNIAAQEDVGVASTIREYNVYAADVDSDGILELPDPVPLSTQPDSSSFWTIEWYNLTLEGERVKKLRTYHQFQNNGGWYLVLPEEWGQLVIYRGKNVGSVAGLVFSRWSPETGEQELFTIYAFTGSRRTELAEENGRFILDQKGETIYSASIGPNNGSLTEDALRNLFHFIKIDWNTGEM